MGDSPSGQVVRYSCTGCGGPVPPDLGEQHGERPVQTALEARMGCAMGVCYSCVVKTTQGVKRVCHDGPVFDQNQLTWEWDHTAPMLSQGIPTP